MACLHERFAAHLSAVNLTGDEARHKLVVSTTSKNCTTNGANWLSLSDKRGAMRCACTVNRVTEVIITLPFKNKR